VLIQERISTANEGSIANSDKNINKIWTKINYAMLVRAWFFTNSFGLLAFCTLGLLTEMYWPNLAKNAHGQWPEKRDGILCCTGLRSGC
jgi:hypothetical protein